MNNTTEDNKLIAEFMEYPDLGTKGNFSYLKYHSSWNWLMPVVEKIRNVESYDRDKFSTSVVIDADKTSIKSGCYGNKSHSNQYFNKIFGGRYNSREHTYKAVVEFIKWYNENK